MACSLQLATCDGDRVTCKLLQVLLEREYGEHIDSNECVWRMNRGPTAGFERRELQATNSPATATSYKGVPTLKAMLRITHVTACVAPA